MSSVAAARPLPFTAPGAALAALLVGVWLAAMAALLWHFETQRIAGTQQLFHFDPQRLPAPPASVPARPTAMYFLKTDCRCVAGALAEITKLQALAGDQLQQIISMDGVATRALPAAVRALPRVSQRLSLPDTPAVALWDAAGELVYFGPIASGSDCGTRSYLLSAWRQLAGKRTTVFTAWDVAACACSRGTT